MNAVNGTSPNGNAPSYVIALQSNVYAQVLFGIFAICIGTRVTSSHRFKSIRDSTGYVTQPPTIPYWIPFVRHALSMAWDTKRFTARCLNQYGDGAPFFIDAAGRKILVLLDPAQIKRVMNASTELDPNPFIHDMILGQMLGSPKETVDFYKNDNGRMDEVQMTHIRQHVTGSALVSMSRKVFERLAANINEFYAQQNTEASEWIEVPDLFDFVQHQVTRAITETLMGSQITHDYPELYADQWRFMDSSIEIVMGLPRTVVPAAYAARDRLLANLKRWSRSSEALRTQGKANTIWDARAGSGLLQERQERYAQTAGFNEEARVSQILGLLFAGNSLTPPISFWYLFEALKDPLLLEKVSSEIHNNYEPSTQAYDFGQLTVRPILQSLHAETTRFYSSNVAVRVVTSKAFALDDKYVVPEKTLVFIYNRYTGQFTPGWAMARPNSTTYPLEQFWAERFLTGGERSRFSDANLTGSWTSFGGGEHKCPGRHFARNIGIATLAVLLGEYEMDLLDKEAAKKATPRVRDEAFGKMVPTSKVAARMRRRLVR
ncbi:cytochrome P450 [Plenodomus tracheiphilus IPT5]|uniref:Cytochrome P450 n=1 Tax=Plenodomus tracheiphilus IPT5 TaxID=1408161 RepID=A0A6A7ARC6_9PLEO|nr:cytochrome P450 [Plenodomus tracheiphilus IPT5]